MLIMKEELVEGGKVVSNETRPGAHNKNRCIESLKDYYPREKVCLIHQRKFS